MRDISGREKELIEEMKSQKLDYLGVSEIKKKEEGIEEPEEGYILYWSGVQVARREAEEVEIIVKTDQIKNIGNEKYIKGRIIKIDTKTEGRELGSFLK